MSEYQPFLDFDEWVGGVYLQERSWSESLALFEAERANTEPALLENTLGTMVRAAAVETGAIEGLYQVPRGITMSIAEQGIEWQAELHRLGDHVPDYYADQLQAFEYALDLATTRATATEAGIRNLHAIVCRHQPTMTVRTHLGNQEIQLTQGAYKTMPNNVLLRDGSTHHYAPVDDVAPEMQRFVRWLGSEAFANAHPVLQSAYSHHALTSIHPFADGNGRVARVLASVFLLRAARIPLVIFSDQRNAYFDALEAADHGKPQALVTFIEDRALDTLAMIRDRLQEVRTPISAQAFRLRTLLTTHGGLTHAEVLAAAKRLVDALKPALKTQVDTLNADGSLPEGVHSSIDDMLTQQCTYWNRNYRTVLPAALGDNRLAGLSEDRSA